MITTPQELSAVTPFILLQKKKKKKKKKNIEKKIIHKIRFSLPGK